MKGLQTASPAETIWQDNPTWDKKKVSQAMMTLHLIWYITPSEIVIERQKTPELLAVSI
jgi:hypothetical protein